MSLCTHSLQLVLLCGSIRNTQYRKGNSEDSNSRRSSTTPWLALARQPSPLPLRRHHQLDCRGVTLPQAENPGSSTAFCACVIRFAAPSTYTTPSLLLMSHPQAENHDTAQPAQCQSKESRTVRFETNGTSKGLCLSIPALVSEQSSPALSCTVPGNRTSKQLLYTCSPQPVWKREITPWPFRASSLPHRLRDKPRNSQMHQDCQAPTTSLSLHFHKGTRHEVNSRLPNPVLERSPRSQPRASPSQRTQTKGRHSR